MLKQVLQMIDWCWGTLMHAVRMILDREVPFRQGWNLAKQNLQGPGGEDAEDDEGAMGRQG